MPLTTGLGSGYVEPIVNMSESDDADFRAYVSSRQQALRRAAYLMCGDWNRADDLVQTTLTKLYVAWHRVTNDRGPDAYAHRILANAVIDERRRPWRRELSVDTVADREDVSASIAHSDERIDIAQALAELPNRQRVTLVLRFWADASVAETAEVLGCSTGTVKSQTARALSRLRVLLQTSDPLFTTGEESS
jgi:RNA polymerase sigma-70 factor (sigma-E family)